MRRRRQLFEFEDQAWCPRFLRDGITSWLQQEVVLETGVYEPVAPLVALLLERQQTETVVDLCSGGGGPWRHLKGLVERQHGPISLTLTDKYPNVSALRGLVRELDDGRTRFEEGSIDARSVPAGVDGVTTLFTGIHHFRPDTVRQILCGAFERRQSIGIFDFADRGDVGMTLRTGPIEMLRKMPRVQPPSRARLVLTYLVPVLPLVILWDAVASCLRAYTADELLGMTSGLHSSDWEWASGRLTPPGRMPVTYLLGHRSAVTS